MQIGRVNMKFWEPKNVALARLLLFLFDIEQALFNFNVIFKSISHTAEVSDIAVVVVVVKGPVIIYCPVGGGRGGRGRRILGGSLNFWENKREDGRIIRN